jgi:hypothetical protein
MRWLEDVEKSLQETKLKIWGKKALGRWPYVAVLVDKKAKAPRRPYSREVSFTL